MKLPNKTLAFLQDKKGSSLLLATATAIATTVGIYFFVSLTSLSEDSKQRVAHLYNAYTMGQSVKNVLSGATINRDFFTQKKIRRNKTPKVKRMHNLLDENFHNGAFASLDDLIKKEVILDSLDPTATARRGADTNYDKENTGVRIYYLDKNGNKINDSGTRVADFILLVNLAGTSDSTSNAPYVDGEPFFYIVMDSSGPSINGASTTIDINLHTSGILSIVDGGMQAEQSVILPQDNE